MFKLTSSVAIALPVLLLMGLTGPAEGGNPAKLHLGTTPDSTISINDLSSADSKYNSWNLSAAGLSKEAFRYAMKGYDYFCNNGLLSCKNLVTIVDFSKSSTQKRLFVINTNTGKIIFNTLSAHGKNSGIDYATDFSNKSESHQSSLGFYITLGTYFGGNGYSLKLKGCEKGFNDKALERAIVMHGADYVSEAFINNNGHLGRSYGCPAVPAKQSKDIIDVIKNGSLLFLYHPTKTYLRQSKILNS